MKSAFPGFPQEGLDFFRKLQRNNRRDWFQPRKPVFDATLKQPMRELVAAINVGMKTFAPEYVTDPDKAIYRIYRDTRFSKDKTPYKDHIAASFPLQGTPAGAGLYFAVSHKEVAIGGGIYMPAPETLRAIRHHVAERHQELRKIVAKPAVRQLYRAGLQGEQLTRVPKGFDPAHPAADLLRYKQLFLYVELNPDLATTSELYPTVVRHFRAITPFLRYLNAPLTRKRPALLPEF
uniref:TIGR02453 family protein n=1 Tax=Solibacter usitatus (strain Ellin6076) TaxID=234267 RepID=Q01NJ4_SOLUE